ncbi:MAG: rhodanese-like domain-containing protein [Bacteroidia bacterium]|nr:rhodanese-like domain-containing protein [Bacteroidia bacterium]NNF32215.1 rhodanese-like domain-containing protein [Flavobacteriaceae bacterium]MBT8276678.1 rhodanese-like domain-containing protein [Bacteroidia bacterium]NNJ81642.1 rhodanese-like domain-containing protein [Flavobacteriaceae bacterium]NNK55136.1 rhodanese-like domain-containing protein [Flavobacteriaceae bacterium]
MKLRFLNILLFLLGFQGYAQESLHDLLNIYNTRSIPYISVEELRMTQIHEKVIILDAREHSEYEISKIEGAHYVGFSDFSSEELMKVIPPTDSLIVVYCSLGIRSEEIGEKLKKSGYSNVRNLYGGIFEWKNKDYPVLDSEGIETEKVHPYSKAWGKWLLKGEKVYE